MRKQRKLQGENGRQQKGQKINGKLQRKQIYESEHIENKIP